MTALDRNSDGYEPRFDIDAEYGRQGELFVTRIIDALKKDSVEVKRDGKVGETGRLYVEFEHDPGRRGIYKPSGISTTHADLYAFVFGDAPSCLVVSTELLRALIKAPGIQVKEETHGSCPTRGYVVSVQWLMYSIRAVARGAA
jgi:hypothetical protein